MADLSLPRPLTKDEIVLVSPERPRAWHALSSARTGPPALARLSCVFHLPPAQYGKLIGAVPPSLNAHPKEKVLGHLIIMHSGNKEAVERDVNKWFDGEGLSTWPAGFNPRLTARRFRPSQASLSSKYGRMRPRLKRRRVASVACGLYLSR